MMRIGIDMGGTKIEGIALAENGEELFRKRIDTPRNDYDGTVKAISSIVEALESKTNQKGTVGIGIPGAISPKTGLVKNANSTWIIGRDFEHDLATALGREVRLANDANCLAVSESVDGAGAGAKVVFAIILGTGCGGGIAIDQKVHAGPLSIAGEWGHHTLYPDGRSCYCGNQGCTESYISGTALESEWKELTGEFATVTDVIDNKMYEAHPEWKENFMMNFGRALSNVIDILDPDAIVMGGGLSKVDLLYTEGMQAVYKESFSEVVRTPIIKNKLGDSGGVFGAAMIMDHI